MCPKLVILWGACKQGWRNHWTMTNLMQPNGRCLEARLSLDWAPSGAEGPPPDGGEGPSQTYNNVGKVTSRLPLSYSPLYIWISKGSPRILYLLAFSDALIFTATGQRQGGWRTPNRTIALDRSCWVINAQPNVALTHYRGIRESWKAECALFSNQLLYGTPRSSVSAWNVCIFSVETC